MFLTFLVVSFFVIIIQSPEIESNIEISQDELYMGCQDMIGLKNYSYCLNDYVKSIFNYTELPFTKRDNLSELKRLGGDCSDYTFFYEKQINFSGFNSTRVKVFSKEREMENETYWAMHVFLIASDSTGYCKLDQRDIDCFTYG